MPDRYSGWVDNSDSNYLNDLSYGNHTDYKTYEFNGNFDFDIRITDWLTFSSVNNFRWIGYYYNSYTDPRSESASGVDGRLSEYQSNTVRRYTNQILRFNKVWGKHSVNALAAYEFNDYQGKAISATGTGFVPGFEVLDVTAIPEAVGGSLSEWAVQSYLSTVTMHTTTATWLSYRSAGMVHPTSVTTTNTVISSPSVPDGTSTVKMVQGRLGRQPETACFLRYSR